MSGDITYVRVVKRTIEIMEVFHSHDRIGYAEKDKVWQGDIQLGDPQDQVVDKFRLATPLEAGIINAVKMPKRIGNATPMPKGEYDR